MTSNGARPRILLTNFHPHGGGGHVTFIRMLLASPLREGFELAVASPPGSRALAVAEESGVAAFPCWFPGNIKEIPDIVRALGRLRAVKAEFGPHLLHVNGGRDHSIAAWSRWRDGTSESLVRTHHAIRAIPDTPYHRWLYQRATAHHTYVAASAYNLSSAGKALKPVNYSVVENGVDLDHFQPRPPDAALRQLLAPQEGEVIFGTCAGLGSYKRVDAIIEAARLLGPTARPFRIVALGDAGAGARHSALAERLGVGERFVYGGFHADVRPWCSLFDVGFVLSDAIETISFAAREMMAMGLPLITSTYAGLLENVEDGYNGWWVRPGRAEDVAAAMAGCLAMDDDERRRMGQRARAKAERRFGVERAWRGMERVYRRVLDQSDKG